MKKNSGIIVYAILFLWLGILTTLYLKDYSREKWRCSLLNCTKSVTGEEWAKENCFLANNQEVCKVSINGVNQLIEKERLNLTAIQQCIEYRCIEETKIRTANYIYNITSS